MQILTQLSICYWDHSIYVQVLYGNIYIPVYDVYILLSLRSLFFVIFTICISF